MPVGIAIGALAVTAGSIVVQADASRRAAHANQDAAREQIKQAQEQKKIDEIKNIRAQRDAIRQARIARAAVANYSANSNTTTSSGAEGASSSIGSQLNSNLGFLSASKDAQQTIFDSQVVEAGHIQEAASANSKAQIAGAIGNLSSSVFTASGGFKTIFSGGK